jgi:hypothetical protein
LNHPFILGWRNNSVAGRDFQIPPIFRRKAVFGPFDKLRAGDPALQFRLHRYD